MKLSTEILDQVFTAAQTATFRPVVNLGKVADVTVRGAEYRVVVNGRNLAYVDTVAEAGGVTYVSEGDATLAQHVAITG